MTEMTEAKRSALIARRAGLAGGALAGHNERRFPVAEFTQ